MELSISTNDFQDIKEKLLFFKGYIIWQDKMYVDDEFIPVLKEHIQSNDVFTNIPQYNGNFLLGFYYRDQYFIANDRWGTYPIYYINQDNKVTFSDNWRKVAAHSSKSYNYNSLIESLAFGHVFDKRTLISDVFEIAPASILSISLDNDKLKVVEKKYWKLNLNFSKGKKRKLVDEFASLWNKQLDIYLNYIQQKGEACFVPLSGGLDSRVIINELDKRNIESYAFTYGSDPECYEVKAATKVAGQMNHCKEHQVIKLNNEIIQDLILSDPSFDLISCSRSGQKELYFYNKFKSKAKYILPGFSGDFMAGSHLKYKMKFWKSSEQIIDYILNYKVSPIIKFQPEYSSKYEPLLRNLIDDSLDKDTDPMSAFIRWDLENRQRKYILRPEATLNTPETVLFLPFFDYKLMDFFLKVPFRYLLSTQLYIEALYKHIFNNNKELLAIERGKSVQKTVINGIVEEYLVKIRSSFRKQGDIRNKIWENDIQWRDILNSLPLPNDLGDLKLSHNIDGSYLFFIINIALFNKELIKA